MFESDAVISAEMLEWITKRRVADPDRVVAIAKKRKRRRRVAPRGRLLLIAADHPARRVTSALGEPLAMADRRDYLARIVRILAGGGADGVIATMDVLEELLILGDVLRDHRGRSFFDEKLLVASMNRGGLHGAMWELDDPTTGTDGKTCDEYRLDGGKFLLRVDDQDERSLATMRAAAACVSDLNERGLTTFLEALPVFRAREGNVAVDKRPMDLARLVGVASALGNASRYMWLDLPYSEDFGRVARATTLPILLTGGESMEDVAALYGELRAGLDASPNVRGAMVGRTALYPPDGRDPLAVALGAHALVHEEATVSEAVATMKKDPDA